MHLQSQASCRSSVRVRILGRCGRSPGKRTFYSSLMVALVELEAEVKMDKLVGAAGMAEMQLDIAEERMAETARLVESKQTAHVAQRHNTDRLIVAVMGPTARTVQLVATSSSLSTRKMPIVSFLCSTTSAGVPGESVGNMVSLVTVESADAEELPTPGASPSYHCIYPLTCKQDRISQQLCVSKDNAGRRQWAERCSRNEADYFSVWRQSVRILKPNQNLRH